MFEKDKKYFPSSLGYQMHSSIVSAPMDEGTDRTNSYKIHPSSGSPAPQLAIFSLEDQCPPPFLDDTSLPSKAMNMQRPKLTKVHSLGSLADIKKRQRMTQVSQHYSFPVQSGPHVQFSQYSNAALTFHDPKFHTMSSLHSSLPPDTFRQPYSCQHFPQISQPFKTDHPPPSESSNPPSYGSVPHRVGVSHSSVPKMQQVSSGSVYYEDSGIYKPGFPRQYPSRTLITESDKSLHASTSCPNLSAPQSSHSSLHSSTTSSVQSSACSPLPTLPSSTLP
ncbi:hypothetical protein ADUPG1_011206, partial [Aduncisulcus paluster]